MDSSNKIKHEDERRIFDTVYGSKANLTVMHEDKPDFWLKNGNDDYFGVEVTQLFINESDARLKKIPDYSSELIENRKFRHKEDKDNLTVDQIEIISRDDKRTKTVAIIQQLPDRNRYLNILATSLIEKNQQIKNYNKKLLYHNLIIDDNLTCMSLNSKETFFNFLFSDDIANLLLNSDFQEIFLVTTLSRERLFFPLKRIFLLSRILLFEEVLKQMNQSNANIDEYDYFNWLGEFLIWLGFKNISLRNTNMEFELLYSCTGFLIDKEQNKIFREYDLFVIPSEEFHDVVTLGFITPELIKTYGMIKDKFGFESSIGYPICFKSIRVD